MNKRSTFLSLLIPSATVFFSSGCIMVLELVASRLIAKHLGSSLYTWTAVIGVVLAGITIGNYLGGRIADRFKASKTLAVLFLTSSLACVATVILNNLVGQWIWLWHFSLQMRIFSHVTLVFLLPSILLGTISPVVAKMALDRGLATGRTVGDIYAWGAAGSIAGTFAAGYYLIATMGTVAIVWSIGAALLLMSILYWIRFWPAYLWAVIFVCAFLTATTPTGWTQNLGATIGLRQEADDTIVYQDESNYCYVKVQKVSENPDKRMFVQDQFVHSQMIMDNLEDFQHFYMHIYAAITTGLSQTGEKLTTLTIGGGGYVYPRYIEKQRPGSRIDVVEIDPGVTEAAMQAFGLPRDTQINTINMDARNYVDELLEKKSQGQDIIKYDFIYEDAINHYSVPFQLVTREFNEKISAILTDDGVYMVNLMDIYDSGELLGSMINTLELTFPNVHVMSKRAPNNRRNTFIIAASRKKLPTQQLLNRYRKDLEIWHLNQSEIQSLKNKAKALVLTDDYVPVDAMLKQMIRQSGVELLAVRYYKEARQLKRKGLLDKAVSKYSKYINADQSKSILGYNEIALIKVSQGKLDQAVEALKKAIDYNQNNDHKINIPSIHLNLALLLRELKQNDQANIHFQIAVNDFKQELVKKPEELETNIRLALTLREMDDYKQAAKYFEKVIDINPYEIHNYSLLADIYEKLDEYDKTIKTLERGAKIANQTGKKREYDLLQRHIDSLKYRNSRKKDR